MFRSVTSVKLFVGSKSLISIWQILGCHLFNFSLSQIGHLVNSSMVKRIDPFVLLKTFYETIFWLIILHNVPCATTSIMVSKEAPNRPCFSQDVCSSFFKNILVMYFCIKEDALFNLHLISSICQTIWPHHDCGNGTTTSLSTLEDSGLNQS